MAVAGMFGMANIAGHQLGYDLWPLTAGQTTREIEVPAISPDRPGTNPLLPATSFSSAARAPRGSAAFGVRAFSIPTVAGPGLTVITGPGGTALGLSPSGGRAVARRRGGGGSAGTAPRTGSTDATPAAVTPQPAAPAQQSSPVPSIPAVSNPAPPPVPQRSNVDDTVSRTGAPAQRKSSTPSGGGNATPPGQAKRQPAAQQQQQPANRSSAPQAEQAPAPAPSQPASEDTGSGQQVSSTPSSGDGRTPSAPPGQGKDK